MDHVGMGHSGRDEMDVNGAPMPLPTYFHSHDTDVLALQAVLARISQRFPNEPITVETHSRGATPVLDYLIAHPTDHGISGLICHAPNLGLGEKYQGLYFLASRIIPEWAMGLPLFNKAKLSDPTYDALYPSVAQNLAVHKFPANGWTFLQLVWGAMRLQRKIKALDGHTLSIPALLVMARDDKSVDRMAAIDGMTRLFGDQLRTFETPDGEHNLFVHKDHASKVSREVSEFIGDPSHARVPHHITPPSDLSQIPVPLADPARRGRRSSSPSGRGSVAGLVVAASLAGAHSHHHSDRHALHHPLRDPSHVLAPEGLAMTSEVLSRGVEAFVAR